MQLDSYLRLLANSFYKNFFSKLFKSMDLLLTSFNQPFLPVMKIVVDKFLGTGSSEVSAF